jgi:RecB family exonuclease
MRERHPHVDDLQRRSELAHEAAARLPAVGDGGRLTWSCPLQAANATRDYYPSALMVEAVRRRDPAIRTASDLRHSRARDWLLRPPSPLAALLTGPAVDRWEARLREAIVARRDGLVLAPEHSLYRPVAMLSARRGSRFSEFEGNLAALSAEAEFAASSLSPTSLEHYGACGFRYFLGSVLRLRGVEEPEEAETIGAAERGTLVHRVLERFFSQQRDDGRPAPGERWTGTDLEALIGIFEEEYGHLRELGRAGLDVYADFDRRQLRADLAAFIEADNDFRVDTGAVPSEFELRLPPTPVGDVQLSGFVDRIDRSPDGRKAWVIDYKTGSSSPYEKADDGDPFAGGTKLQLPVYVLAAAGADEVEALYWFVSRRAEFKRIPYEDTPENRQRFEATLQAIRAGQRAGAFPAVPGDEDDFYGGFTNCKYCDFDRLCSRRRTYELQEKSDDPAMKPWLDVGLRARGEDAT